jgi:hypothetical protein
MPALKCTRVAAARARLKRKFLASAEPTSAPLGNWYVTLTHICDRNVLVYMSERSLLSFIMIEGERVTPEKLSTCFLSGMNSVLELGGISSDDRGRVISQYATGQFSPADNFSALGSLSNISQCYAAFIEDDGGFTRCNLSNIIQHVNTMPLKRLGFETPFKITATVVSGAAT